MAILLLLPSKTFLPVSFKNLQLEISHQKQKEQRQNQPDVSFFWCLFFAFLIYCKLQSSLLFTFCQVWMPVKKTAEIETGMAEKSSWDQANLRQKLGLVLKNRKKISQILKDYFYLPFFLLIILCGGATLSCGGGGGRPKSHDCTETLVLFLTTLTFTHYTHTSPTYATKNLQNRQSCHQSIS